MAQFMLNTLTLSNINRFSKFFHCQNQEKICNNVITKDPTTPHLCHFWATLYGASRLCADFIQVIGGKDWFCLPTHGSSANNLIILTVLTQLKDGRRSTKVTDSRSANIWETVMQYVWTYMNFLYVIINSPLPTTLSDLHPMSGRGIG